MARPKIPIDAEEVEKLAGLNCSTEEIGSFFNVSADTIQRRFAVALKRGRAVINTSLKRQQYKLAMDGNVTLLIWLGKQLLGQADKSENTVTYRKYEVEIGGNSREAADTSSQYLN